MELVVTGGPARLEGGWWSAACIANCSLTSSLIICKGLGREVSPSDVGFVAGEPKYWATDELETEVLSWPGTMPRVTNEWVECHLEPPRPRQREWPEPLLVRVLGIPLVKAGAHEMTEKQNDDITTLTLFGKITNDERYAHVRSYLLAMRGGSVYVTQ